MRGGDIVALYHSARADGSEARNFWYDEYLMNAQIGRFSKPYVALMDGIVTAASASRHTAASASSPTPRKWRCPKWVSA